MTPRSRSNIFLAIATIVFVLQANTQAADKPKTKSEDKPKKIIRALIIDGQNNHDWKSTTPLLKQALESSGRFKVDVATAPGAKEDNSNFKPRFSDYKVVISNYNGKRWPESTEKGFAGYVANGGGFVTVHAADNSFPGWPEYNRIIGVGGWEGRTEKSGPRLYLDDQSDVVRDKSPGRGGHHGQQHEFQIRSRDTHHPVTRGIPALWLHTKDELYDSLRGPAESLHVLATAYSDPNQGGTGHNEPVLMTIEYGKGRVFHTVLGHADYSMNCVGFVTTFTRGAEWAATGEVTIPVPGNFPTADKSSPTK